MSVEAYEIVDKLLEKIEELTRKSERHDNRADDAGRDLRAARDELAEVRRQLNAATAALAQTQGESKAHLNLFTAAKAFRLARVEGGSNLAEMEKTLNDLDEALKVSEKITDEIPF